MKMSLTGKNFIGNDNSAKGNINFNAVNPATRSELDTSFYEATSEEVDQAAQKAEKAFKIYRNKSGEEKAVFLETIADEILTLGDELINRCMAETGLPEARITGERGRTMNQLKLFAALLRECSWLDARIDPQYANSIRTCWRVWRKQFSVGIFGCGR
jgi:NADP-dependent aldehyde dehydrogenase